MPSISQHSNGDSEVAGYSKKGDDNSPYLHTNGHTDAYQDEDVFQHLPKPQQDVLLLHGPRQKYALEKNGHIPELRSEREILVQVRTPSHISVQLTDILRFWLLA